MDKKYIFELFNYNFQVNQELLTIIEKHESPDERILNLISHILTAEKIWLMRLQGKDLSGLDIWPVLSLNDCQKQLTENRKSYADYLENISDRKLTSDLIYKNSKGDKFNTPIRDILMHVIIHGGYHRGQIASTVRKEGGEPINTDYIHYVRFMKSDSNL